MLHVTCAQEKGPRVDQEDRFIVHSTPTGVLCAVMEGHGGEDVAEICHDYLGSFWDLHAKENRPIDMLMGLVIWQLEAITSEYHSGSTISLAFVPNDEELVWWATLGDSPVIVRSPDGITHVSTSHNARENQEECDAAIKRGAIYRAGYIWNDTGDMGVGLQMTRCLGDSALGLILSREPDIQHHAFGDFLLLATDGVFDPAHGVLQHNHLQSAADVVLLIDQGADAQSIVDHAINLPTGDNATAILVKKEKPQ